MTKNDDGVEFIGMTVEVFLFRETPCFSALANRVRQRLGWMEKDVDLSFEVRIDVRSSSGLRLKVMAPVSDDGEWKAYVDIVMNSEVRALDLVVRKV